MKVIVIIILLSLTSFTMPHTIRNVQSGYTQADFWNNWNRSTPRIALFVKITPNEFWTGADVIGFTSNTRDMTLPAHSGVTFKASPAITPTAVEQVLGSASNGEFTGIYQDGLFERNDILAGKYQGAEIEVFSACWDNVNLGEFLIGRGFLGEFRDYQTYFTAEMRGLMAKTNNDVSVKTQRMCRVKNFRDTECGHTASTVTIDSNVYPITVDVSPDGAFAEGDTWILVLDSEFSVLPPDNFFANGTMECLGGLNDGLTREIARNESAGGGARRFQLKRPFPYSFTEGTTVLRLTAGCNRTLENCKKFSNAINFRGEPFVPGIESANKVTTR